MDLYHFSENPNIAVFEPRTIYNEKEAKVWTIDKFHSPHYYLPRDCPRVCIWPDDGTTEDDLNRFFGLAKSRRMIAIESSWYDRVRKGYIYRYIFDANDFELHEPNAGYYISTRTVKPLGVERIDDLIGAILDEGIELRVTPSLMQLQKAIPQSTVQFSMIRMRNAVQE